MAFANQASAAAPAGLASSVTGAALAGAAAGGGSLAFFTTIMTATKLNIAIIGGLILAGTAGVYLQQRSNDALRAEIANLRRQNQEIGGWREANLHLRRTAAETADLRQAAAELPGAEASADDAENSLRAATRALAERRTHLQAAYLESGQLMGIGSPLFDVSQLDHAPAVVASAPPKYPSEMRQAGISGRVVVGLTVDASGSVQNAHAVELPPKAAVRSRRH